ncbi:hypothetical protein LRP88_14990 [Fusarium phalaenopsidis]
MRARLVSFCFSVIVTSLVLTKLIHLSVHARTVPMVDFGRFLPSLLLPDVAIIGLSRLIMRRSKTAIAKVGRLTGCAASSQLGFFYKTGSEFKWTDAQRYARDKDGLKILLNEVDAALAAGLLVATVSWFAGESVYRATGALLAMTGMPILNSRW